MSVMKIFFLNFIHLFLGIDECLLMKIFAKFIIFLGEPIYFELKYSNANDFFLEHFSIYLVITKNWNHLENY